MTENKTLIKITLIISIISLIVSIITLLFVVIVPTINEYNENKQEQEMQEQLKENMDRTVMQSEASNILKQIYVLDLSDGKLDGKDNGIKIEYIPDNVNTPENDGKNLFMKNSKYDVDEISGTYTFEYIKNNYKIIYDGTKWKIEENNQ